MKPKLVPNAGRALWRAYSMWPVYFAGLLELAPYIVPELDGFVPQWAKLAILCLSPLGRILNQGGIDADQ